MGTTVVVAYLRPSWNRLYLAHVGDSRCYRVRGEHVEVLTHDHTILNDVMEMRPDVGDDVLARLPRSVVTRALGMGERIRVDLRAFVLVPGDRYLLCSDGLYRDLPEDVLFETLRITAEPEEVAQRLIALGKKAGGGDNLTALVFDCVRLGKPSHDKQGADSSSTRRKTASAPEILLLGIESDVTPHSFRHGLATEMVRRRVRESTVQTILGHASPQTTRIYVHKTAMDVSDEYQDAFGQYRPPS